MPKIFTLKNGTHVVFDGDIEQAMSTILHALGEFDAVTAEATDMVDSQGPEMAQIHLNMGAATLRDVIGQALEKAATHFPADGPPEPCEYCHTFHTDALICKAYVDARIDGTLAYVDTQVKGHYHSREL